MVKNRIQALLARHHVPPPAVSDLFGQRGRDYLSKLELEGAAQELVRQDLELLKTLTEEVRATEQGLQQATQGDHRLELLRTVPGLGELLATVSHGRSTGLSVSRVLPNSPPTPDWCRQPIPPVGIPSTAS